MTRRQRDDLFVPRREEGIGVNKQRIRSLPDQRGEPSVDLSFAAGIHNIDLQSQRACGFLDIS
jgi:hypothetical protein